MSTTIRKSSAKTEYCKISNASLQDPRLKLRSRGLLAYLLSLPSNWTISIAHLATISPDGRHTIRAAMAELKKFGYMSHEVMRDVGTNKIKEHQWTVYDDPSENLLFGHKLPALNEEGVHKSIYHIVETPHYGKSPTTKEIEETKETRRERRGCPPDGDIVSFGTENAPIKFKDMYSLCLSCGLSESDARFAAEKIMPNGLLVNEPNRTHDDFARACAIWSVIGPNAKRNK